MRHTRDIVAPLRRSSKPARARFAGPEAIDHVPADHDAGTRLVAAYIDGYYNVPGHETPITFEWKRTITEMAA